jgi:hypothetical protein
MSLFASASKIAAVVAAGYIVVFFVLVSGLVNAVTSGGARLAVFIAPTRNIQTPGETAAITLILIVGMVGTILLHKAGKPSSARMQRAMLGGGFGIIMVAMMLGYLLVNAKL